MHIVEVCTTLFVILQDAVTNFIQDGIFCSQNYEEVFHEKLVEVVFQRILPRLIQDWGSISFPFSSEFGVDWNVTRVEPLGGW